MDRGKSLLGDHAMVLLEADEKETQQPPLKDMPTKSDILDGGGHEAEVDKGKSAVLEELVPRIDSKFKSEMGVEAVIGPDTYEAVTDSSTSSTDESPALEPFGSPQSLLHSLKKLKEEKKRMEEEMKRMEDKSAKLGLSTPYTMVAGMAAGMAHLKSLEQELSLLRLDLKILGFDSFHYDLEIEGQPQKQQQSQLVSCAPPENEIRQSRRGRKKGRRRGRAVCPPVGLQSDSAMEDPGQVQGCEPWPTVEEMHRLGLEWQPPSLDEPDPFPDLVMPELPVLSLPYPKDDVSGAGDDGDDDMKKEMDRCKSAQEIAEEEKEMAAEAKNLASYRSNWESSWGASGYGSFPDMTTMSPMHFTHWTPGCSSDSAAIAGATLQVFTIKLAEIKGGLQWPLSVYGVIAARDCVDRNRNLLFSCDRRRSQKLDQDELFFRLIGPSRAIVFTDPVDFEIQLRVKGRTLSQDRALISGTYHYTGGHAPGVFTICFKNCFCTAELCMERIEQTVQATILGVRVKNGPWPFEYGGQVACFSPARAAGVTGSEVTYITDAPSMEVVLLASRGRTMPKGSYGYLHLSRHVVSVELQGSLKFVIQAYSESGDIAAQGQVCFVPKDCNISQMTCSFGDPKVEVEITVAWSLLVSAKRRIAVRGWDFEGSDDLELALSGFGV